MKRYRVALALGLVVFALATTTACHPIGDSGTPSGGWFNNPGEGPKCTEVEPQPDIPAPVVPTVPTDQVTNIRVQLDAVKWSPRTGTCIGPERLDDAQLWWDIHLYATVNGAPEWFGPNGKTLPYDDQVRTPYVADFQLRHLPDEKEPQLVSIDFIAKNTLRGRGGPSPIPLLVEPDVFVHARCSIVIEGKLLLGHDAVGKMLGGDTLHCRIDNIPMPKGYGF